MSDYDTREAAAILKRATSDRDAAGRERASIELYEAMRAVADAAGAGGRGLYAEPREDGFLAVRRGKTTLLVLDFGKDGVRASASEDGSNAEDLPVEYDGERFVGKEEDTFVHPVPGEPRVRRAATAVIAERIAQALAEKYLR